MTDLALAEQQWHDWIRAACTALDVDPDAVDVTGIHALTKEIAHGFARPDGPGGVIHPRCGGGCTGRPAASRSTRQRSPRRSARRFPERVARRRSRANWSTCFGTRPLEATATWPFPRATPGCYRAPGLRSRRGDVGPEELVTVAAQEHHGHRDLVEHGPGVVGQLGLDLDQDVGGRVVLARQQAAGDERAGDASEPSAARAREHVLGDGHPGADAVVPRQRGWRAGCRPPCPSRRSGRRPRRSRRARATRRGAAARWSPIIPP